MLKKDKNTPLLDIMLSYFDPISYLFVNVNKFITSTIYESKFLF